MEQQILGAALGSREAFFSLEKLNAEAELTPLSKAIYVALREFYTADTKAMSADKALIKASVTRKLGNPKNREAILEVLEQIDPDASAPNVERELMGLRRANLGYEIASLMGAGDADKAAPLMERYLSLLDHSASGASAVFNSVSLDDLEGSLVGDDVVQVAPKMLADKVGRGLVRGSHVVIFGRPNKGKSLIAINQAAKCLMAGQKVLFVENEDPAAKTISRLLSRLTGLDEEAMLKDKQRTMEIARAKGYENFFLADMSPGTYAEIRALVEEHKPDVVFLNQIRNFSMPSDNRTEQLEQAAIQARNLAKKYNCVVFSVTQAGDSATNKLLLTQEDVEYSKTGVAAACDLMIGVGGNAEMEPRQQITLCLAKNKLTSKHGMITCKIDPMRSKVVGLA